MSEALYWIGSGLVGLGALLALFGAIGVLRFPDVYTRIHAASVTDTGGATLILLGLGLIAGATPEALKLALIWAFIMLTTPAAANALANGAYGSGLLPRIGTFKIVRDSAGGRRAPGDDPDADADADRSDAEEGQEPEGGAR